MKDLHNHLQYDFLYQPAKQQLERIRRALIQQHFSKPGTHNAGISMAQRTLGSLSQTQLNKAIYHAAQRMLKKKGQNEIFNTLKLVNFD